MPTAAQEEQSQLFYVWASQFPQRESFFRTEEIEDKSLKPYEEERD